MKNILLTAPANSKHLLLGNEAIVRGALEAGVHVITCYPGTPSSEVPDTFYKLSPFADYYFEYSANEKVALEVAAGASFAGALSFCTMKHVGVNVAADPLLTLAYTGAPGGFLLLSADDPACHSSQNEQDNRYFARLASLACFEPSSAQEAKDMTKDALLQSKKLQTPMLLRTTTRVNHLRGSVTFGEIAEKKPVDGFVRNMQKLVPIPAFARTMHLDLLKRMELAEELAETTPWNSYSEKGTLGVIASGISRAYLIDALAELKLAETVSVFHLGMSYPLANKKLTAFLKTCSRVLVLEELEPLLEDALRVLIQKEKINCEILGKKEAQLDVFGEYDLQKVMQAVQILTNCELKEFSPCTAYPQNLPPRPPNLCAGCPHRATYYAARKIFGDDALYSGDIGCYTLGLLPPLNAVDFLLCMGSSISAGCGAAKVSNKPVLAFIGDSTFFHSGLTGLANAVYNQHNILFVIMDNLTTAMTGHQPNPSVPDTVLGESPVHLDIEKIVQGFGVKEVRKVNPLNLKKTMETFAELKALTGVRVLIAEEICPLHARRIKKNNKTQRAYVAETWTKNDTVLEDIACPAFYSENGIMKINPILCAGCMLCLQVSPNIKAKKKD